MRTWLRIVVAIAALAVVTATASALGVTAGLQGTPSLDLPQPNPDCDTDIAVRYVAGGDGVVSGRKDLDGGEAVSDSERFSEVLTKKLQDANFPYCLYNTAKESTTTDDYQDEDIDGFTQQSKAWDLRPRLITLMLGRENDSIKNHISTCMDFIKDHQFIQANVCALAVLGNQAAWKKLNDDLSDILNQYKVQMAGSDPDMVVAVMGYFNPYPSATDVATEIPGFCAKLVDTIPTCTIRWVLLPPVLVILDQIVKKLNSTIEGVVQKFTIASQGRFYFVNPYDKFEDHCMKMNVDVKTKVYHPTNTIDEHNSENDFGCSEPWIESDGKDGTLTPFTYLPPAVTGVLILATQTTSGMGAFPNDKGHKCLADLVYEADNGWGLLKNKLDIPEASKSLAGCGE